MNDENAAREDRAIRVDTVDGAIEGWLRTGAKLRTLDDLNVVAKRFVTIYAPKSLTGSLQVGSGPLSINKDAILFVRELSPPPPRSGSRLGDFTRVPVQLRVKHFEIQGLVDVPPGGSPMKRLDQDTHPFVSLTSVLVAGPDGRATTPFLAVNRSHVTTAQVIEPEEEPAAVPSAGAEAER
jgi:hypothetical protein